MDKKYNMTDLLIGSGICTIKRKPLSRIYYICYYKIIQGVMSNDLLGSARWATFRNRRMTAKSGNPHKDWFDASYQLGMVTPKPCISYKQHKYYIICGINNFKEE